VVLAPKARVRAAPALTCPGSNESATAPAP
jgi:hypothetical protein